MSLHWPLSKKLTASVMKRVPHKGNEDNSFLLLSGGRGLKGGLRQPKVTSNSLLPAMMLFQRTWRSVPNTYVVAR